MATKKSSTKKSAASKDDAKPTSEQAVLVTTLHRGVFFGFTTDPEAEPIRMRGLRCALYWSADVGGFTGLAEIGPTKDCRISATNPNVSIVRGVTFVSPVTDAAQKAWTNAPVAGR